MKTCAVCSVNYPDAVEYCPRDGQRLPPPPGDTKRMYDPLIGQTIDGRYIIEALLGEGGMGFVYAARHAIIDKRVAMKVLRKDAAAQDESAAQRFIVEARAASKIGHQNIVDITDFGVLNDGHAYFVMEFLDGPTLGLVVHREKQLQPLRAVRIAIQIARGLAAAHEKSIIHRDLKPENIFVLEKDGQSDFVKIVDFGIAKDVKAGKRLTAVGMVLGTPEYMSPEQATGQETDHRVDMYALGCIVYEMLTGEVPFKGENAPKTLTKHVFDPVVPPSKLRPDLAIPAALEQVVMRTLQKKPGDRYTDMRALIAALETVERQLLSGQAAPARRPAPTGLNDRLDEVPRSAVPKYVALAAGAVALVALGGAALTRLSRAAQPAAPTPAARTAPAPVATPLPTAPTVAPSGAAAAPSATPAEVHIQLSTVPAGAEVMLGSESLGPSPVDVHRAPGAAPVTLTVRHPGFREVTRRVVLDRDQTLQIVMQRRERPPVARAERSRPAPKPAQPPKPAHRVTDLRNPFE